MKNAKLGASDLQVSTVGFGCWAMGKHGWQGVTDRNSIAAVHTALDSGVTLFDTADVYGLGHSETVLSEALGASRHSVVVATKGGVAWDDRGRTRRDISPSALRHALEASLRRLRLETIPLYQVHWPDGVTPIADAVGELERCREEGLVRWIGLCNCSPADLDTAREKSHTVATQFALNILDPSAAETLLPYCEANSVAGLAYSPLAQGLLGGAFDPTLTIPEVDIRSRSPYYQPAVLGRNVLVSQACAKAAASLGLTSAGLAIRWVLAQPGVTSVLSGAKTPEQVRDNLRKLASVRDEEVNLAVDAALAVAGLGGVSRP